MKSYWGEISQNSFDHMIAQIEHADDFNLQLTECMEETDRKDLYPYSLDIYGRMSWRYLLEKDLTNCVAADLGAGWGAITEGLASECKYVYCLEGDPSRCNLLNIRKQKKGWHNVEVKQCIFPHIDIPSNSVDLVCCNGVLEWVPVFDHSASPTLIQKKFLREIFRILKDDGVLYIGIENRFSKHYFRGKLDHTGLKYTSLMPRWMASLTVAIRKRSDNNFFFDKKGTYRNYTYTAHGYKQLLEQSGFETSNFFAAEYSYDIPFYAYPLAANTQLLKRFFSIIGKIKQPLFMRKFFATNFFIYASKSKSALQCKKMPVIFGFNARTEFDGRNFQTFSTDGTIKSNPIYQPVSKLLSTADILTLYQNINYCKKNIAVSKLRDKLLPIKHFLDAKKIDISEKLELYIKCIEKWNSCNYHGDFWIDNIMQEPKGKPVLIDPETQWFGWKELDLIDFCFDFDKYSRQREYPCVNTHELLKHIPKEMLPIFLELALLRQLIRYSPYGRPNVLFWN